MLVGHSDGASIALIYAAHHPARAVVAIAPHVFVEEMCLVEIRVARNTYESGDLRERMARHHRDPDAAFFGWNDVWLDPEFPNWSITDEVERISCPLLLIQGERDQYGTMAQLDAIELRARARSGASTSTASTRRRPRCPRRRSSRSPNSPRNALVTIAEEPYDAPAGRFSFRRTLPRFVRCTPTGRRTSRPA